MNAFELAKELALKGVTVEMRAQEGQLVFFLPTGFYKSSSAHLKDEESGTALHSRYGGKTFVHTIEDVVAESYAWYKSSKEKSDAWEEPDQQWVNLYQEFGYGRMVTKFAWEAHKS